MLYLSSCNWLISLSKHNVFRFHPHCSMWLDFLFYGRVIFHCMYVCVCVCVCVCVYAPHFLCAFICWWTFRLLLVLAVVKGCGEHRHADFFRILISALLDRSELWLLDGMTQIFFLFMVTHATYGSSWARGWIGVAAEAYTTATATLNLSHIFHLHCSLWQCRILNPLSGVRD